LGRFAMREAASGLRVALVLGVGATGIASIRAAISSSHLMLHPTPLSCRRIFSMKFAKLFVVTAMTAAISATAQGQVLNCGGAGEASIGPSTTTCRLTNTVSSTVSTLARLTLDQTSTTLTAPRAVDFGTPGGVDNLGAVTIHVSSNANFLLAASPATPKFSPSAGGSANKPAGDLTMRVGGVGSFVALGNIGSGSATDNVDYTIDYNTKYNWTIDTPGVYTLVVNYTLTAP
jgi:hypothetical protein